MKIEMGESLIYSWLRHEKQCQLAQTNWKSSGYWEVLHYEELADFLNKFQQFYSKKYNFDISKGGSVDQFLKQAEIDVLGIAISQGKQRLYAVDIAFHESGLNYGDKEKTLNKIILKCVRSALCLYGYFGVNTGEIAFASPKINPAIEKELTPLLQELSDLFLQFGLSFAATLYCNSDFETEIMQPVLQKSKNIADTNELFLRSVQMYQMFGGHNGTAESPAKPIARTPAVKSTQVNDGKANEKIPKWATAPSQNNHKIIRAYLQLFEEHGRVTRPELERRCQSPKEHPDVYVPDFYGNFASMKTDKGNSHGKVFTDDGYNIGIWEVVEATIEQYRSLFLK